MGLKRPNQFRRGGRTLPGQSSDEELGLERGLTIKVVGQAAVINQELVYIGDVGTGNYLEISPDGIKIHNEGAITELWADVDGNLVMSEFRVTGTAADPNAYVGMRASNYAGTKLITIAADTEQDRVDLDAELVLIGQSLRFTAVTTTERNALSAVNGMLVYNSTVDKFQGYAAGAWVDLH